LPRAFTRPTFVANPSRGDCHQRRIIERAAMPHCLRIYFVRWDTYDLTTAHFHARFSGDNLGRRSHGTLQIHLPPHECRGAHRWAEAPVAVAKRIAAVEKGRGSAKKTKKAKVGDPHSCLWRLVGPRKELWCACPIADANHCDREDLCQKGRTLFFCALM
jgi:hypothetical protein